MLNKIFFFLVIFMLSCIITGCATPLNLIQSKPIEKPKLNLAVASPLELTEVDWTIVLLDKEPLYQLNQVNYNNLVKDTQLIQNRLYLDENIIHYYKSYYENN